MGSLGSACGQHINIQIIFYVASLFQDVLTYWMHWFYNFTVVFNWNFPKSVVRKCTQMQQMHCSCSQHMCVWMNPPRIQHMGWHEFSVCGDTRSLWTVGVFWWHKMEVVVLKGFHSRPGRVSELVESVFNCLLSSWLPPTSKRSCSCKYLSNMIRLLSTSIAGEVAELYRP